MVTGALDGPHTTRTVVWQPIGRQWLDHCLLRGTRSGWSLEGTIVGLLEDGPLRIAYRISTDRFWQMGMIGITLWHGVEQHSLRINRGPDGVWTDLLAGQPLGDELATCEEIDLAFTPATNTIPIRRLDLEIGESREMAVTYVTFPELTVKPMRQRYTRLAAQRYRYESGPTLSEFSAEIDVDADGLVTAYPNAWQRLPSAE
jgi:hypothetical protein